MKKKITLKEIAKKCKVSTATVSFVLNNKNRKGISISTWNKVEKVFEKYGYIKNKKKTSLKKIIFLLEAISIRAASRFLVGINNQFIQNNEFIFLFNAVSNKSKNIDKIISKHQPDGLILATGRPRELNFKISNIKANIILLNCWSKNYKGITILADEYASSKYVIKNLINKNKKNIAIILPKEYWWQSFEDRLSGWRDAYTECNLTYNSSLICKPNKNKKYISESEIGYLAIKNLINKNIKFDSIFATSDFLAMGCYQAINEQNLEIPKDISLIGFDNSETAENLKPGLSSIHLPIPEMTTKALEHVLDNKNYDENYIVHVDCKITKRNSIL